MSDWRSAASGADQLPPEADRHLLALQYLTDELSAEALLAFEAELASGGPACDALADCILIQQAVVQPVRIEDRHHVPLRASSAGELILLPTSAAARTTSPRLMTPLASLATLLLIACLLGQMHKLKGLNSDSRLAAVVHETSSLADPLIASRWSELGSIGTEDVLAFDADESLLADEISDSVTIPEWMLVAASINAVDEADSTSNPEEEHL